MSNDRHTRRSRGIARTVRTAIALAILAGAVPTASSQDANAQHSDATASSFRLCGNECGLSLYYVGLSRFNSATAKGKTNAAPVADDRIYRNVADLNRVLRLPSEDIRLAGVQGIEFANSRYEITANRIGFSQKSEDLTANSIGALSEVKAGTRLLWGDTFRVSSRTLAPGTPVSIQIQRSVGGAGQASDFAFYWVATETYHNRNKLVDLNYTIARAPGGADVIVGDAVETQTIQARVGESFTIESLLSILDGVEGKAGTRQFLTEAFDSVGYEIRLDPGSASSTQACLRSISGTFVSGRCS
jgi:membrane-associated protease RseP (regulator of RpoE activity)